MDKNIFTIDSDCSGMTVKEYILGYLGYSVGVLKKLKYSGKITVNGKEVFVNHLLSCGEILQLTYPEEPDAENHLTGFPVSNSSNMRGSFLFPEDRKHLPVHSQSSVPNEL